METENLPTLGSILHMRMDCNFWSCASAARTLARECGHKLFVCHHRNPNTLGIDWQITVRHGNHGEAVMIISSGDRPLSSKMDEIREWIGKVHEYEQLSS